MSGLGRRYIYDNIHLIVEAGIFERVEDGKYRCVEGVEEYIDIEDDDID